MPMKKGYKFGITLCTCGFPVRENHMIRHRKSGHTKYFRYAKRLQAMAAKIEQKTSVNDVLAKAAEIAKNSIYSTETVLQGWPWSEEHPAVASLTKRQADRLSAIEAAEIASHVIFPND